MFFQFLLVLAISCSTFESKPFIIRNISDCSLTDHGILHYQGRYSISKFEHDCLSWIDLEKLYPEIITEENFFNDQSIKQAKNFCRNPNSNIHGPWCFVQNENLISIETCAVCQSLAIQTTLPTEIDVPVNNEFFGNLRDEIHRYTLYLQERFYLILHRMKVQLKFIRDYLSNSFHFFG